MNVILFGKKVFADVIKLTIWRRDHPGLPGWALHLVTSVLTGDRRGKDTHGEGRGKTEGEAAGRWAPARCS